ncbi:MAG: M48 family metallopeptidase [Gemmatimonadales bacterium]
MMRVRSLGLAGIIAGSVFLSSIRAPSAVAQAAPGAQFSVRDSLPASAIPQAAQLRSGVRFDPAAATAAYLATLPPAARAKSDAYFEGGYWLQLWSFLLNAAIMLLFLGLGWSRRLRDWAGRRIGPRWARTFLYFAGFTLISTALSFPFTIYSGFVREHAYGLATQGFGGWMRDQLVALAVTLVLGGLLVVALYGVVRRFPRGWPVLGAGTTMVFAIIGALIFPVFIAPLFNRYSLLADARIREPILRMARANGIDVDRVYVMDASRQTTRISANVSGLLGTQRITLNDNLLRRSSLPEIEAVMGHEMGHYVLHHVYQAIVFFTLLSVAAFALLRFGFAWAAARWGERWGVRTPEDVAGLPLMLLLFSTYLFVLTPLTNTYTRADESAADIFGLNASRQPDGFAVVALQLSEYRKLDPGPLEEVVFFDHPSGRARIRMAMEWKAESQGPGGVDRSGTALHVPPTGRAPAP